MCQQFDDAHRVRADKREVSRVLEQHGRAWREQSERADRGRSRDATCNYVQRSTPKVDRAVRDERAGGAYPGEVGDLRAKQMLGDHGALDLARAFADLADLRVSKVPLDVELARVAVSAVNLQRTVARPARGLARE